MIIVGHIEEVEENMPKCKICGGPLGNVSMNGICFACIHASVCEAELIYELNKKQKEDKKLTKVCKKFTEQIKKQERKTMPKVPNMLTQFIKDSYHCPYGVLVARKINGEHPIVRIGVSLCNNKVDVFNKKIGVEMALNRCLSNEPYTIHASGLKFQNGQWGGLPTRQDNMSEFCGYLFWFMERASRYFKGLPIIYPSNMNLV